MKIPFDNSKDLIELDRAHAVAAQMVKNGQGFTKSIGAQLAKMDIDGVRKFKKEFSSYYVRYERMLEDD